MVGAEAPPTTSMTMESFLEPLLIFFRYTKEIKAPFGWNYKPTEKHRWLIFCERKILFRLKKNKLNISQVNRAKGRTLRLKMTSAPSSIKF
jgi:hypothetical protein